MLAQLKKLDVDGTALDEMLALRAFAKSLRVEFETSGAEVPEWLDDKIRALNREVQVRLADSLEKRLKDIAAQKTGLETAAEKRARLALEEEKIKAQLASVAR